MPENHAVSFEELSTLSINSYAWCILIRGAMPKICKTAKYLQTREKRGTSVFVRWNLQTWRNRDTFRSVVPYVVSSQGSLKTLLLAETRVCVYKNETFFKERLLYYRKVKNLEFKHLDLAFGELRYWYWRWLKCQQLVLHLRKKKRERERPHLGLPLTCNLVLPTWNVHALFIINNFIIRIVLWRCVCNNISEKYIGSILTVCCTSEGVDVP